MKEDEQTGRHLSRVTLTPRRDRCREKDGTRIFPFSSPIYFSLLPFLSLCVLLFHFHYYISDINPTVDYAKSRKILDHVPCLRFPFKEANVFIIPLFFARISLSDTRL